MIEIDWQGFAETALLLYEGPWVAERTAAVGEAIAAGVEGLDPTVSKIIAGGQSHSAVAAHQANYRLADLRAQIQPLWDEVDGLIVPTVPRVPTLDEVAAEPVAANSALGTYTNFTNLLDLCALALPIDLQDDAPPMGLTLLAPAWQDEALLNWGEWIHPAIARRCGASEHPVTPAADACALGGWSELIVFGAHLRGQPLNHRLQELGGHFVREVQTAPAYRMLLIDDATPHKPGLLPVADGVAIYGECWRLPPASVAELLAEIPAPLGLGQVQLAWLIRNVKKPRASFARQAKTPRTKTSALTATGALIPLASNLKNSNRTNRGRAARRTHSLAGVYFPETARSVGHWG